MPQSPRDPYLAALDDVQQPPADPFLDALDSVQAESVPQEKRSLFARLYDAAFTPPAVVTRTAERVANYIDAPLSIREAEALATRPVVRAAGRGTAYAPEQSRAVVAGATQGVANLLTPGDAALTAATFGEAPLVRLGLSRAAQAVRGVQRAASGAQVVRGAERTIGAQSVPEAAAGIAETALGGIGLHGGRAPEPAPRPALKELPAGPRFVGTPRGEVAPVGTDIPMAQAPDGSFVRGVPAEYARHEIRGELPPGPRFVAGAKGEVGTVEQADQVLAALDQVQGRSGPDVSSVRSVPAAVLDRDIDPTVAAKHGVRVRQYSGDVNAESVPTLNDEQRRVLTVMREDLQTFAPQRGRLVRNPNDETTSIYARGGPGSAVADDVRVISGQHVSNNAVAQAVDDLLAGKPPTNKLHTAVLDAAQGYVEGRPGYRGPELPLDREVSARLSGQSLGGEPPTDAEFDAFSQAFDDVAGTPGGREPGEAGFVTGDVLARLGGGAVGGAVGASGGDPNESPARRAARIALGVAAGVAAPSLLRGRGASAAARVIDRQGPSLAPRVVAEATTPLRQRAARSGTPMADPLAGMDPLFAKFNPLVRDGIKQVITQNAGFGDARRGTINTRNLGKFANEVRVQVDRALPKGAAANAETITALARALQKTTNNVTELSTLVNAGRATDADLIAFKVAMEEQRNVAQSFTAARSEAGRALAALNFWGGVLDSGDVDLIRKVATPLKEEAARIAKGLAVLPDDPLVRYRWLQQQQAVSPWSYLRTYYLANLLSGPLTQVRNTLGNLSNAVADVATLPVAAGIDTAKSAVRGTPRTVRLAELPATVSGSLVGLEKGWQDALFALRNGLHPAELTRSVEAAVTHGKMDVPARELPGGGANPLNWSFRAMTAADALARTTAYEGELSAILFNQARNEGLSGQRLLDRVAELRAGMNPEAVAMRQQAAQYAARRVFLEEPGDITKRVMLLAQSVPGSYFVLPFIKISSSIARQGAEFSPVGFLMKGARAEGRTATQAQARATAGTLAAGYLFWLAASGRISGDGPSDPAERNALFEKGWKPNAVKVGDRWYGYQAISPINIQTAAIANAVEAWRSRGEQPQEVQDVIAQTFARMSNTFLESTFLQGAFNLVEALKDPERSAPRFFGQTAFGLIPGASALRTVQRAMDPVQRQPQGVVENVKAALPGLSEQVPARIDRFGEQVRREGGSAQRALDPFASSTEKPDLIAGELDRLKVSLTVPQGRLLVNGQPLTREEAQQLKVRQGQAVRRALETLINGAGYSRLSDDSKQAALKKRIGITRAEVNAGYRREVQRARARQARGETVAKARVNAAIAKYQGLLKGEPLSRAEIELVIPEMSKSLGRTVTVDELRQEAQRRGVAVE